MDRKKLLAMIPTAIGIFLSMLEKNPQYITEINLSIILLFVIGIGLFLFLPNKKTKLFDLNFFNHSVFQRILDVRYWAKKRFVIENPRKKAVFEDILNNVLLIYEMELKNFIKSSNKIKNPADLNIALARLLNTIADKIPIYYEYNETGYTDTKKDTIRTAIRPFMAWHGKDIDNLRKELNVISLDEGFYGDISSKITASFLAIEMVITSLINNARSAIKDMNGDLETCYWDNQCIGK